MWIATIRPTSNSGSYGAINCLKTSVVSLTKVLEEQRGRDYIIKKGSLEEQIVPQDSHYYRSNPVESDVDQQLRRSSGHGLRGIHSVDCADLIPEPGIERMIRGSQLLHH